MEKEIKTQRSIMKRIDTFFVNFKKCSAANRTKGYLLGRKPVLEKLWQECEDQNMTIEDFEEKSGDDLSYFENNEFAKIEEKVFEILGSINDGIEAFAMVPPNPLLDTAMLNRTTNETGSSEFKLPRIELPYFDGDYDSWRSFHDLYVAAVHSKTNVPLVQKLQFLKSRLKGEAADLLEGLPIIDANYAKAWTTLVDMYNNKKVLITAQLRNLFAQHKSPETAIGIRKLLTTTNKIVQALENLDVGLDEIDLTITFQVIELLPNQSRELWAQSWVSVEFPKYKDLQAFLEIRFRTLEVCAASVPAIQLSKAPHINKKTQSFHSSTATDSTSSNTCKICGNTFHPIRTCPALLELKPSQRLECIQSNKLCKNCFAYSHAAFNCKSQRRCGKCSKKHNTLLHDVLADSQPSSSTTHSNATSTPITSATKVSAPVKSTSHVTAHISIGEQSGEVLLATALVNVQSSKGKTHTLRALLDQASQASFITESAAQLLGLRRMPSSVSVSGVGKAEAPSPRGTVHFEAYSFVNPSFSVAVAALVMPTLTHYHPNQTVELDQKFISDMQLADPSYGTPGAIDVILSADIVAQIMVNGLKRGMSSSPVAQNSKFGWVLFGRVKTAQQQQNIACCHTTLESIDKTLRAFHEIEELPTDDQSTNSENSACEQFYRQTVQRKPNGRYQVSLPFKNGSQALFGRSRDTALARFHQLERRFERDAQLKSRYIESMANFIAKGIMVPTSTSEDQHSVIQPNGTKLYKCCYLPHHGVVKETSTTTKLRTVFDASCITSNGQSLNETLLTGPVIQDTLITLLLRWRKYRIVFKADIAQMYLQVLISDADSEYQRLLWRPDTSEPILDYKLNTVTFGTAAAPYLAIRTLHQLANDEAKNRPIGAKIIVDDFYVDDLMAGADTVADALIAQRQIIEILKSGGFDIRKWASNSAEICDNVGETEREICETLFDTVKTLGLNWNPATDQFLIKTKFDSEVINSKRKLLSAASRLFDPLGWVAPSVIIAKMLLQKLWLTGLSWDEPLPDDIKLEWDRFANRLTSLEKISLPRWIGTKSMESDSTCELHAFCDASEKAYAAVVYLRTRRDDGSSTTYLLIAKTRVAPIKKVSLPRLELCGALLASKLVDNVSKTIGVTKIYLWSDSLITLDWIRALPSKWKTFVANRVSEIQQTVKAAIWNYVPSKENPADCASRGLSPSELPNFVLWWEGPSWLRKDSSYWPIRPLGKTSTTPLELKRVHVLTTIVQNDIFEKIFERSSSLTRVIRVTAYCTRWKRIVIDKKSTNEWLEADEIENAKTIIIKHIQQAAFSKDMHQLQNLQQLDTKSSLVRLVPFIDHNGLVRVGGRLQNSKLPYDERHPIVLPKHGKFTELVISKAHVDSKHGGPSLMIAVIRKEFWIIDARNSIRQQVHMCVRCFRYSKQGLAQLMGNLPEPRVTISRPFTQTGVDYAGPMEILTRRGRGRRQITKGYVSLFICLATKAIHLELVGDLTTQTFLSAFNRFSARRGRPKIMYSDCGTNFVGAARQLERDFDQSIKSLVPEIAETIANDGTEWSFIPPAAPHFGGLWEAGVKSMKYHLKRILGNSVLTYEEMSTTLTEIEGCLNSRPLCPMTSDITDLTVLTPAHFLIGDSIIGTPRPTTADLNINRLDRWQQMQQLTEHFWQRWSADYLNRMQQRPKWLTQKQNLQIGDMVLVRDERLPPSKWIMGRVTLTHPGQDALVRAVTIKTSSSTMKRPITKLCRLPIENAHNSNGQI